MVLLDPVSALRRGRPVVLFDEDVIEGGAELLIAAEVAHSEAMAFLVRYTSGFVTVALPVQRCNQLDLPAIAADPYGGCRPVPAVTVDAAEGIGTGISAADRSCTARLLADPATRPDQLTRPGHLVPLRVPDPGPGPLTTPQAALALCEQSGLLPGMVRCELVHDDGPLMSAVDAVAFALEHGLAIVNAQDVALLAITAA